MGNPVYTELNEADLQLGQDPPIVQQKRTTGVFCLLQKLKLIPSGSFINNPLCWAMWIVRKKNSSPYSQAPRKICVSPFCHHGHVFDDNPDYPLLF
ncbi:MAG: hypothetical protein IPN29_00580 [Saprospiraceae bacterium]|nr:hypothetical protein [Saprospiraceae bacterium]